MTDKESLQLDLIKDLQEKFSKPGATLSNEQKALIVREFFTLADAIMDQVGNDTIDTTSLAQLRMKELIKTHSDPASVRHLENIQIALQYLVDASFDARDAMDVTLTDQEDDDAK